MSDLKFKIYTLGCKVNQYDSANLGKILLSYSFKNVSKNADLAIINTCAVTKIAVKKSVQMIKKARKENPQAKIVLFGCFPQIYYKEAQKLKVDVLWRMGDFEKLVEKILDLFDQKHKKQKEIFFDNQKTRYILKIQEGCEQFCTYCIIPFTRGKLKNLATKDVIKEAKNAVKHNYKEIVLTGTNLGKNKDLLFIIKEILKIKNLLRLRLSSIELEEINDNLITLIKSEKKLCKHLHISLQSGSSKILKAMNRPYDAEQYRKTILKIKKEIPDIAITTDIIVGFPGESEEDFLASYNLAKELAFSRIHVFPFSAHEKTPAFLFKNKVSNGIIKKRSQKLRNLAKKLQENYKKQFRGRKLEILVEKAERGFCCGKTEYYFELCANCDKMIKKSSLLKVIV